MTFDVVVGAGTLRSASATAVVFPHQWTVEGVTVEVVFTGVHLLHLAVAGCVLNDVYREAAALGVSVDGVRVTASGGFDVVTWRSSGIDYRVEIDSTGTAAAVDGLLDRVAVVAEIPRSLRAGAEVKRVAGPQSGAEDGGASSPDRPART